MREVANRICSCASDSFRGVLAGGAALTSSVRRFGTAVELPVGFVCNEVIAIFVKIDVSLLNRVDQSYTLEHVSENVAALLSAATLRCGSAVAIAQYDLFVTRLVRTIGDEQAIRALLSASSDSVSQKVR